MRNPINLNAVAFGCGAYFISTIEIFIVKLSLSDIKKNYILIALLFLEIINIVLYRGRKIYVANDTIVNDTGGFQW